MRSGRKTAVKRQPHDDGPSPERKVPLLERYRAARRDPSLVVIEGVHALRHAMRFGAEPIEVLAADPDDAARLAMELAPDVADRIAELAKAVDPAVLARLTPAPVYTGVIALAPRPRQDIRAAMAAPGPAHVVFLEEPANTYNIGAVVRVCAAADAAALLVSGKHDPWNPGSVRAGAGLQFALPCARVDLEGETKDTRVAPRPGDDHPAPTPSVFADRPLVAVDPAGEVFDPSRIPPRAVLAFGTERQGLSDSLVERAELRVRIPMKPGVSSLNLSTAVSAVLYAVGWRGRV